MNGKRLNRKEIIRIIELVKQGDSLNQISVALSKPKTTIYYHFRKIKGRTIKPLIVKLEDEELIGEFIGLFAGDGCLYKTKDCHYRAYLYFNITEKSYVKNLIKEVLLNLFGKEPMIFRRENRLNLCYYSKNIHKFIGDYLMWDKKARKTYSIKLKKKIHSQKFIIGFIRGSLDSDGYFSKNKISFATVSEGLMKNISDYLDKLCISHSVNLYKEKRKNRKDIYHITVSRKEYDKFVDLINPRNKWC